jgi:hypothetical protein
MTEAAFLLAITEANHDRDGFFALGGAGFDTAEERTENLSRISRDLDGHVCEQDNKCYFLDVLDSEDQFSVIDEIEISERTAHQLLGVVDFEPLRQQQDANIAAMFAERFPDKKL